MTKCYLCEKENLIKKKVEYKLHGTILGKFDAEVCSQCNETFFNEKASDEIDSAAKERGLWKRRLQ